MNSGFENLLRTHEKFGEDIDFCKLAGPKKTLIHPAGTTGEAAILRTRCGCPLSVDPYFCAIIEPKRNWLPAPVIRVLTATLVIAFNGLLIRHDLFWISPPFALRYRRGLRYLSPNGDREQMVPDQ